MADYRDLFDIEQRPGAGLGLWTGVLERQLERVRDANYRHRLHHSPVASERREDPGAEDELHGEVYFLVLAIRRVMLFADVLAGQVEDRELDAALTRFRREAPGAREMRNLFEHVDEYLLDRPGKHMKRLEGRVSPVLICRWDADNVVVAYGPERFDATLAATAAIKLGRTALGIWEQALERTKAAGSEEPVPSEDDGVPRALQVQIGVATIIEGGGGPQVNTGRLRGIRVREITQAEAEELRSREA